MSTISGIEDTLITTVKDLALFKLVDSLGRKDEPVTLNYPAAFVYFAGDKNTESQPRPIFTTAYDVLVIVKNLKSEDKAAKDAYVLIDAVRDAINGKALSITDIEKFICMSRELVGYEAGVITYRLQFQARHYLAVPS